MTEQSEGLYQTFSASCIEIQDLPRALDILKQYHPLPVEPLSSFDEFLLSMTVNAFCLTPDEIGEVK